jgi:hypothetical protein
VALPVAPVVPAMATLMTWLLHVSAVHVKVLVVLVTRTPLGLWGVVFVVVEEEEMLQPGPAAHIGRAPALTRSICASLSRSAAHALPTLSGSATRPAKSKVFIRPSLSTSRATADRDEDGPTHQFYPTAWLSVHRRRPDCHQEGMFTACTASEQQA